MKKTESAGVVVYTKTDNEILYLLLKNAKGHWDFPKGMIESGEDKKKAALRELKEEAGITAKIHDGFNYSFSFSFIYDGKEIHKSVHFFAGRADSKDVKLSKEHTEFVWLPYDKAKDKFSYQEQRDLLKEVNDFVS